MPCTVQAAAAREGLEQQLQEMQASLAGSAASSPHQAPAGIVAESPFAKHTGVVQEMQGQVARLKMRTPHCVLKWRSSALRWQSCAAQQRARESALANPLGQVCITACPHHIQSMSITLEACVASAMFLISSAVCCWVFLELDREAYTIPGETGHQSPPSSPDLETKPEPAANGPQTPPTGSTDAVSRGLAHGNGSAGSSARKSSPGIDTHRYALLRWKEGESLRPVQPYPCTMLCSKITLHWECGRNWSHHRALTVQTGAQMAPRQRAPTGVCGRQPSACLASSLRQKRQQA